MAFSCHFTAGGGGLINNVNWPAAGEAVQVLALQRLRQHHKQEPQSVNGWTLKCLILRHRGTSAPMSTVFLLNERQQCMELECTSDEGIKFAVAAGDFGFCVKCWLRRGVDVSLAELLQIHALLALLVFDQPILLCAVKLLCRWQLPRKFHGEGEIRRKFFHVLYVSQSHLPSQQARTIFLKSKQSNTIQQTRMPYAMPRNEINNISLIRVLIFLLNLFCVLFCRVAWAFFVQDDLPLVPEWMEDPTTLIFVKYQRRRGIVFVIRFVAASLFFFSATIIGGYRWTLVAESTWIWAPEGHRVAQWAELNPDEWMEEEDREMMAVEEEEVEMD
ncbi:hypothetical protein ACN47E_001078 [Coniothyrium glycines]